MSYLDAFWMPVPIKITDRISSITNAFISSIVPVIVPTEAEVEESLRILSLDPADLRCAYCGDKASEWDHLRPLVVKQRPTGYISEIRNLVPSCGKCNQSKGNKEWRVWIRSPARHSPQSREIPDLSARIERLERYDSWEPSRKPLDLQHLIGDELWAKHWDNWTALLAAIKTCQGHAQQIADRLRTGPNSWDRL